MVEERTRHPSHEPVLDGVTGHQVPVILVRSDLGSMEVHAVGNVCLVGERKVHRVSLADAQHRARHLAVEGPRRILDPRGDLHRGVTHLHPDMVEASLLAGSKLREKGSRR